MTHPSDILLRIEDLSCSFSKDHIVFSNVNLTVNKGDVIAVVGRSGGGKTTFLKCIAHMNTFDGNVLLYGKKAPEYGIPNYRTRVLYVPQRPSMLPGTPREFIRQIQRYGSRKKDVDIEPAAVSLGESWSLSEEVFDRPWASLSGGEAQRAALAVACSLPSTEILLLDEPTSALDSSSAHAVEKHLVSLPDSSDSSVKAIFWITHSDEQTHKATRILRCERGIREEAVPNGV